MKTGAIYIRVSTDKQEELSPDAQKRLLLEYASKNDIVVSNEFVYTENGISGRKANKRPEFMKMISLAKSKDHPFDVILVWKFSRFARNQEESIVYKSLLKKNNVEVVSVSEPLVDGPFGSLIERIIEWMDEYYSIRLSGEVMRGMAENALRGNYQASPPIGYKKVGRKGDTMIIDEEKAFIVRKIFDLYVDDRMSIANITRKINELGYKTARGGEFERRTIQYILKNPTYYGMCIWNQRDQTQTTQRYKDKSDWIIVKGKHEPIISEELYNNAQTRMKSEELPKRARPEFRKHWLSGMIKCSDCGRSLAYNGTNTEYFQCTGYKKGKCNTNTYINAKKIESQLLELIKTISLDTDFTKFNVKRNDSKCNEIDELNDMLKKIDNKEKRIKQAYINEIDTLEEYKDNKKIINSEKASLLAQIDDLKRKTVNAQFGTRKFNSELNRLAEILSSECVSIEVKQIAIRKYIDKIIYNRKADSIDIYWIY